MPKKNLTRFEKNQRSFEKFLEDRERLLKLCQTEAIGQVLQRYGESLQINPGQIHSIIQKLRVAGKLRQFEDCYRSRFSTNLFTTPETIGPTIYDKNETRPTRVIRLNPGRFRLSTVSILAALAIDKLTKKEFHGFVSALSPYIEHCRDPRVWGILTRPQDIVDFEDAMQFCNGLIKLRGSTERADELYRNDLVRYAMLAGAITSREELWKLFQMKKTIGTATTRLLRRV